MSLEKKDLRLKMTDDMLNRLSILAGLDGHDLADLAAFWWLAANLFFRNAVDFSGLDCPVRQFAVLCLILAGSGTVRGSIYTSDSGQPAAFSVQLDVFALLSSLGRRSAWFLPLPVGSLDSQPNDKIYRFFFGVKNDENYRS